MKSLKSNYDHQLTSHYRNCTNGVAAATCVDAKRLVEDIALTEDQFYEFCQLNRDFRIERNPAGELVIMPPTGSETDQHNFDIIVQLGIWTKQDGTGVGFGSSGGFTLPNGAVRRRSPS